MALYWHPYLAELLRQDYGDRLVIEEELSLGDMPLRADLLLIRRDPDVALPFPFSLLGERTLVEYKSPDDAATHDDLVKLETYGLLYAQREALGKRQDLNIVALSFPLPRAHIASERRLPGRDASHATRREARASGRVSHLFDRFDAIANCPRGVAIVVGGQRATGTRYRDLFGRTL